MDGEISNQFTLNGDCKAISCKKKEEKYLKEVLLQSILSIFCVTEKMLQK